MMLPDPNHECETLRRGGRVVGRDSDCGELVQSVRATAAATAPDIVKWRELAFRKYSLLSSASVT